jgi:hypothetical protein
MAEFNWRYERLDENYNVVTCPQDDKEGKYTGYPVLNLPRWYDENPDKWKEHGWTKHITHEPSEVNYNKQTQYLVNSPKRIDEYTIEDEFHVLDKSEEQLLFEEMLEVAEGGMSGIYFF